MQRTLNETTTWRRIKLSPDNHWNNDFVTISQDSDWKTDLLEDASINWASTGSVDVEFAAAFTECMQEAVKIANQWNSDTGKKLSDAPHSVTVTL